jgi:hypothetical protein
MSDSEVLQKFCAQIANAAIRCGIDVDVAECKFANETVGMRQVNGFNDCLAAMSEFEWAMFLDVDELLVCNNGVHKFLDSVDPNVAALRIKQFLFDERFTNGVCSSMFDITTCYGKVMDVYKGIYRMNLLERMNSVHCKSVRRGNRWTPTSDKICYFHFRGCNIIEAPEYRYYREFESGQKKPFFRDDHVQIFKSAHPIYWAARKPR